MDNIEKIAALISNIKRELDEISNYLVIAKRENSPVPRFNYDSLEIQSQSDSRMYPFHLHMEYSGDDEIVKFYNLCVWTYRNLKLDDLGAKTCTKSYAVKIADIPRDARSPLKDVFSRDKDVIDAFEKTVELLDETYYYEALKLLVHKVFKYAFLVAYDKPDLHKYRTIETVLRHWDKYKDDAINYQFPNSETPDYDNE